MKIEVLGTGCKSCDTLYENVVKALEKTGMSETSKLEKTDDIDYFAKMGVFTTPGLVIEGELISSGRVLSEDKIADAIRDRSSKA
jgi:small redox-active disulfide protein 2